MIRRLFILLMVCSWSSCERLAFADVAEDTPISNFETLWEQVRLRYAFFESKGIDWDGVRAQYEPLIKEEMTEGELFNVLEPMINELQDGHSNIYTGTRVTAYYSEFLNTAPELFDLNVIRANYVDVQELGQFIRGTIRSEWTGNQSLTYVYYPTFKSSINKENLDQIVTEANQTDGVIIDIRQNGGGQVSNVFRLVERFTFEDKVLYETQFKIGANAEDWSATDVAIVENKDLLKFEVPIVIMTDRGSFSSSSYFALASKYYDDVQVVGDTTAGGLGMYGGGGLPNGWTYRCSISRTLYTDADGDKINYEEGVPPDVYIVNDLASLDNGNDLMLERAIDTF